MSKGDNPAVPLKDPGTGQAMAAEPAKKPEPPKPLLSGIIQFADEKGYQYNTQFSFHMDDFAARFARLGREMVRKVEAEEPKDPLDKEDE